MIRIAIEQTQTIFLSAVDSFVWFGSLSRFSRRVCAFFCVFCFRVIRLQFHWKQIQYDSFVAKL